ncbi:hypothetical protein APHCRT_1612 [Anaplasma phagocytophilum str. CRT53-1]|uniref:Uncharacterized protein n=1 Tax=Anaplasma phagocytophilum str. CRT53-1 TaxID=1359157 RepID=A0A0F3PI79_ANAPH|nr:hypothetical protein APHCRT_1612 [Anaplasma phagocytophilum str. CRT53-1]
MSIRKKQRIPSIVASGSTCTDTIETNLLPGTISIYVGQHPDEADLA